MTGQSERTLSAILSDVDLQYSRLKTLLSEIPEERLTEAGVSGHWSAKDLLSHVSYWIDEGVDSLSAVLLGKPGDEDSDWQATNEKVAAERSSRSIAEAKAALHASYISLIAGATAVADDHEHAQAALATIQDVGADHLREHVDELSIWWEKVKNG